MNNVIPQIFDRQLYADRQARARAYGQTDLMAYVAVELSERLGFITRKFENALLISNVAEPLIDVLKTSEKFANVTQLAPSPDDDLKLSANTFNAVISILDLQCVNDVPGYLVQLRRSLKPDGLLLLCLFAGDTLKELREVWLTTEEQFTGGATPRIAPMIDGRALGALLQRAGLALPLVDQDRTILRYADPLKLLREIKSAGFANPLNQRTKGNTSRNLLSGVLATYTEKFSDPDGKVRATMELGWATAWCPDASQPKPLAPGSAKTRLADALKVPEVKL